MLKFFDNDNQQREVIDADREMDSKQFGEIKVIGAGLPRTGTLSLKSALTQLYGGKCYHMMNVFGGDQEDVNIWMKAERGEMEAGDWRDFFKRKNYVCGVDFPFSLHYKAIMEAFPEAKIVLSVRDPKTWHGSVYNSIWQIETLLKRYPSVKWMLHQLDRRHPAPSDMIEGLNNIRPDGCHTSCRGAMEGGPEAGERFFNEWVAEVKRSVPADRLLVHSAKEGWPPLCNFLDIPVPDTSYPRVNDTASIQRALRNVWMLHCVLCYCLPAAAAVALGCFFRSELTSLMTPCSSLVSGWLASFTQLLGGLGH